jgi:hypothetical protein
MIDYIKYTLDGKTYQLIPNGDGTWSRDETAPKVSGNYSLLFEVSDNGYVSFIDSSLPQYEYYLSVIESIERRVFLEKYVLKEVAELKEFTCIFDAENEVLDQSNDDLQTITNDMLIKTASNDMITDIENFLEIKGQGTLDQRKYYLMSIFSRSKKFNEARIKEIVTTLTGAECAVFFYSESDVENPNPGKGFLQIKVLSPDGSKDYLYSDVERSIAPLVPSHLQLAVVRFFSTWYDIIDNYASWDAIRTAQNWDTIKSYIPPQ